MMVSLSGTRGIGKTYHLAKEVYRRYQEGFFVVTNFSHLYTNIDGSRFSPEEFIGLMVEILRFKDAGFEIWDLYPGFKHTGIFIGIDEGHLYFSADLFKRYQDNPDFQDIIKLLAQARKQDVEIWYTTQDPAKIDKNWRRYTEDWVRFTPFFNLSYKKPVMHDTKPIFRREMRYLIPLVWQEWHDLDMANPAFNYSTVRDEDGISSWSPKSTIIRRRLCRSGWLDPFPYRLYNSNQVLAVTKHSIDLDYPALQSNFSAVEHTFKKEKYPLIKSILRMKRTDEILPTRYFFKDLKIASTVDVDFQKNILKQPSELIDDMRFLQERRSRSVARLQPRRNIFLLGARRREPGSNKVPINEL